METALKDRLAKYRDAPPAAAATLSLPATGRDAPAGSNRDLTADEVLALVTSEKGAGRRRFGKEHLGLSFAGLRAYCEEHRETAVWQAIGRYLCDLAAQTAAGRGLILQGPTGTGKTGVLALLAEAEWQRYFLSLAENPEPEWMPPDQRRKRPKMEVITAVELADLLMLRKRDDGYRDSRIADLTHCDHLLIDDFGAEYMDAYALNSFYKLIDDRYIDRRCTHLTVNVTVDDYARSNPNAARIVSRLRQRCYVITLAGPDRRARLSAAALEGVGFG
ncbi:MAG: hypothetical protein ACYDCO_24195 [Armatimonadota bacterium]